MRGLDAVLDLGGTTVRGMHAEQSDEPSWKGKPALSAVRHCYIQQVNDLQCHIIALIVNISSR